MPSAEKSLNEISLEVFLDAIREDGADVSVGTEQARLFLAKAQNFLQKEVADRCEQLPRMLGKFCLLRLLGLGGFGRVYLADDTETRRHVAIKLPHQAVAFQPQMRKRWEREARAAGAIEHPNIVRVLEAGEIEGQWYLVSEYAPGMNLAQWLALPGRERVEPREAAQFMARLADAMAHAHRKGVIHRDLKPSNILLVRDFHVETESLGCYHPKITDFGLAKILEDSGLETRSGVLLGTLQYMAPEQADLTCQQISLATDIYALGLLLFELIVGRPMVSSQPMMLMVQEVIQKEAPRLRSMRSDCPADLETVCAKCLEKNPADRYPSAAALKDDLDRFVNGQSIRARPRGTWKRLRYWAQREPVFAAVLLTSLLAMLIVTLVFGYTTHQTQEANERYKQALQHTEELNYLSTVHRAAQQLASGEATQASLTLERYLQRTAPTSPSTWEWRYLQNQIAQQPLHYEWYGHQETPYFLALSPDGRRLASTDQQGDIIIRDAVSGNIIRQWKNPGFLFRNLCYGPKGKMLAAYAVRQAGKGETVFLWNADDGSVLATFPAQNDDDISCICFHPTMETILIAIGHGRTGSYQGKLVEWHFRDRQSRTIPLPTRGLCLKIMWVEAIQSFVVFNRDATLRLSDQYKILDKFMTPGVTLHVMDASCSPDGRWIAWADLGGTVLLFDLNQSRTQPIRRWQAHPDEIKKVEFNPGSTQLVTSGTGNVANLWDIQDGRLVKSLKTKGNTWGSCFSKDGKWIYTGTANDFAVHRWSLGNLQQQMVQLGDQIWCLAIAKEKDCLLAGLDDDHSDKTLRVFQLQRLPWACVGQWPIHPATTTGIVPLGGNRLVTASLNGDLTLSDTPGGQVIKQVHAHGEGGVRVLAGLGDGQGVASSGWERDIYLWDAQLNKSGTIANPHDGKHTTGLYYDSATQLLYSSGDDGKVLAWNLETKQMAWQYDCHSDARCFAISGGKKFIAIGTKQGFFQIVDLASGRLVHEVRAHGHPVCCLTFTPDDKALITGDQEGEMSCWQVSSGEPLLAFPRHHGRISSLIWNADGSKLYSASHDGNIVEHDFGQ